MPCLCFRNVSRGGSEDSILNKSATDIPRGDPATFLLERSQSDITHNSVVKANMLNRLLNSKLGGGFFKQLSQVSLMLCSAVLEVLNSSPTEIGREKGKGGRS